MEHTRIRRVCWIAAVLCAVASAPSRSRAAEPETVMLPGPARVTLQALLYRPPGAATPRPAVLALHGCGGNYRADGKRRIARVPDWTNRFLAAGYVVLWPDSFGSRGLGSQCAVADRQVTPRLRAGDAVAAANWLAQQAYVDTSKIALIGWSNGGSTVLRTIEAGAAKPAVDFKRAIAFYPGCRPLAERTTGAPWSTRLPLTILMGAADDWTSPEPCRDLGRRGNVRYVEYPGAFHDFDAPDSPVRVRTGLTYTANNSGRAHVGTDPAGRAAAILEVMRELEQAFKP